MADDLRSEGMKNEVKGAAKELGGKLRDAAADITGDKSENGKGKMDRIEGEAQQKMGRVQQKAADEV